MEVRTIYIWYCPNCKNEVSGAKNSKNEIRSKCQCGVEMIRTILGRRHTVLDIYAPSGQEQYGEELDDLE